MPSSFTYESAFIRHSLDFFISGCRSRRALDRTRTKVAQSHRDHSVCQLFSSVSAIPSRSNDRGGVRTRRAYASVVVCARPVARVPSFCMCLLPHVLPHSLPRESLDKPLLTLQMTTLWKTRELPPRAASFRATTTTTDHVPDQSQVTTMSSAALTVWTGRRRDASSAMSHAMRRHQGVASCMAMGRGDASWL